MQCHLRLCSIPLSRWTCSPASPHGKRINEYAYPSISLKLYMTVEPYQPQLSWGRCWSNILSRNIYSTSSNDCWKFSHGALTCLSALLFLPFCSNSGHVITAYTTALARCINSNDWGRLRVLLVLGVHNSGSLLTPSLTVFSQARSWYEFSRHLLRLASWPVTPGQCR